MKWLNSAQRLRVSVVVVLIGTLLGCHPPIKQYQDTTPLPLQEITPAGSTDPSSNIEEMLTISPAPTAVNYSPPLGSSTNNLFLLLRSNPVVQIWQYQYLYGNSMLLYENNNPEKQFNELLERIIPGSELSIYTEFDGEYPRSEVSINQFWDGINVSVAPSGQSIAWVEETSWCPTITCYGYSQVVIYDVETKQKNIIANYNFHLPLQGEASILIPPDIVRVIELAWSPNEESLAITTDYGKGAYKHLGIYGLQTQILTEVVLGGGASIPTWSNDSNQLAYSRISPVTDGIHYTSSIEIVTVHSDGQITLESNVEYGTNTEAFISELSWSPDDTQIVAVANPRNLTNMNILVTVDVNLGIIHDLVIEDIISQGAFSKPKWSHDGHYLGVNYRSKHNGFVDQLIVFDPESGQVQAVFQSDRPEANWEWSEDNKITLVEGQISTSMQVSLWDWQASETEVQPIFASSNVEGFINGNNVYISILGTSK